MGTGSPSSGTSECDGQGLWRGNLGKNRDEGSPDFCGATSNKRALPGKGQGRTQSDTEEAARRRRPRPGRCGRRPGATGGYRGPLRARTPPFAGSTALPTPRFGASSPWDFERINCFCFKPPSLQSLTGVRAGGRCLTEGGRGSSHQPGRFSRAAGGERPAGKSGGGGGPMGGAAAAKAWAGRWGGRQVAAELREASRLGTRS